MWLFLGFLQPYHSAALCVRSFPSVPAASRTGCSLVHSLGLIQQAMRSGARLLLASPNFGSGLPAAFCAVASMPRLLSLWASALPEGQSKNLHFYVSEKQAKCACKCLSQHRLFFSPLLKFARYSISVPPFFLQIFRLTLELFCEKWC